jgi:putative protein kinase ArgK-like GTPase of G3E family
MRRYGAIGRGSRLTGSSALADLLRMATVVSVEQLFVRPESAERRVLVVL